MENVLQLMTLQLNELCSRRKPSLLRATTKGHLTQFDFQNFQKLISEWKERAPIFYAFLVTCASSQKENPEWFPSVAVAGSINTAKAAKPPHEWMCHNFGAAS